MGLGGVAAFDPSITGENGSFEIGGNGGVVGAIIGGAGGDLGQDGVDGFGTTNPGLAGAAIDLNGFAINYIETGTILGAIIP